MSNPQLTAARQAFLRILELICFTLMAAMAIIVVVGVTYRSFGAALVWYDEVASILLAWLTYYGSALAAYRGGHIAVTSLVDAMPRPLRLAVTLFAEACVIGFFILLGWVGWSILEVLATDTLVSLPDIRVSYAQSVIPIGSFLFVVAELLRLPDLLTAAATPKRMEVNP
jgi:TRAP-type C4-dicarboxylate transport system permease small subunit